MSGMPGQAGATGGTRNHARVRQIVPLILLPAILVAQNAPLSEAVRKLVDHPQLGSAELTLADGGTETGSILRVTDQFVVFMKSAKPAACEDVDLSRITAVKWLKSSGRSPNAAEMVAIDVVAVPFIVPFYAGHTIANLFRKASPPLKPLRGVWEPGRPAQGALASRLEFTGGTVSYVTTTSKRGRWAAEQDRLRLTFEGGPESVSPFHFDCGDLVLENPVIRFRSLIYPKQGTAPVLGNWESWSDAHSNYNLNLKRDGSFTEQKREIRKGTFENTATSVKMRWTDTTGPGDAEWIAQIQDKHIVLSVGGETIEYRYVPPKFELHD